MTNKFILWDSPEEPFVTNSELYTWGSYSENDYSKSLLKYVDSNGSKYREIFISWTQNLGQTEINGKSLIEYLKIDNSISFWWMSSFVEKSPWKTPSMIDVIRLIAIEELLTNSSYDCFELVSNNNNLDSCLRTLCARLNIKYIRIKNKQNTKNKLSLRVFFHKLPYIAQALIYLFFFILQNWHFLKSKKPEWSKSKKSIFLCSQFAHLDKKLCKSGKFYSRLWENLPEFFNSKGYQTNFIHLYLKSSEVNSSNEAIQYLNNFNLNKDRDDFHSFLFSHISVKNILEVLKLYFKFYLKSWNSPSIDKSFKLNSNLDLWPIIKDDWYSNICGLKAIENLLWLKLFDKALSEIPYQNYGLFLKENQSWEKALIFSWNKYNHGSLFGVVHSCIRFWDLRYFENPRDNFHDKNFASPRPHRTIINGEYSKQVLIDFGSYDDSYVECEAIRYNYISNLPKRSNLLISKSKLKKVLVLGDYSSKSTFKLLNLIESLKSETLAKFAFTFKSHPNFIVKSSYSSVLKFSTTMSPLVEIIDEFDIAICGNLTTASLDAYLFGISVIVAYEDNSLNFSPLRKTKNDVFFVSNSSELEIALFESSKDTIIQTNPKDYFCLDNNLTKWSELLSI